ncbi:MAG: enoyl-CoA hydratase/isomerase family protein [Acidobacteriota bacterium]|nr:enoyl-CoA hydratase/isomerase family protein [Acidobacteriota bacterium]
MSELIRLESPREGVALVTMTHPAIQNFGSWEAISDLAAALARAREDGARVSVLASGVEGHWFEHAWLTDLQATMRGELASGDPAGWFHALQEITHDDVVSLAAINGHTSGGGVELGWACDLRIADEQACFGQPEVMIGVATGIGGTSRLARLIGRTATAEMVLDGAPMTARRIYELGGLNRVVPNGSCVEVALEWASRLADRPPASLRAMKKMLKDNDDLHLSEALRNEQKIFQTVASTAEAAEGMRKMQERFDSGESPLEVYGGPRR